MHFSSLLGLFSSDLAIDLGTANTLVFVRSRGIAVVEPSIVAVNKVTNRVEAEAMAYIEKIDELGGIVAAIEVGFPQREIADAAYRYQKQTDDRIKNVVGVNKYTMDESPDRRPPILKIGPEYFAVELGENLADKRRMSNDTLPEAIRSAPTSAPADEGSGAAAADDGQGPPRG